MSEAKSDLRKACEAAAKEICGYLSNPKQFAGCVDYRADTIERHMTPVFESYANGLIAAAVEACVKHVPSLDIDWRLDCSCGWSESKDTGTWADHIRSTVTPEAAAKELERIKAEAWLEAIKDAIGESNLLVRGFYDEGEFFVENVVADKHSIAALEAAARKEE